MRGSRAKRDEREDRDRHTTDNIAMLDKAGGERDMGEATRENKHKEEARERRAAREIRWREVDERESREERRGRG